MWNSSKRSKRSLTMCVLTWLNVIKNKKNRITFESNKLQENSLPKIKEDLTCNWDQLSAANSVNENYNIFNDQLVNTINKYTEVKTIKIPYKKIIKEPWLMKGIIKFK